MKNDEKERKKQWNPIKNMEKNSEQWWTEEEQTKKAWWKRVKQTMNHDEKERKKQGNMMKNRVTTMKNDET